MYIFQTFNCGLKFDFSVFWEEKSLNFENIFTHLLVLSILLTSVHDQDIIGSNLLLKINYKKLLTELRGFKFVTTLVLVFKKIESDDKTKYGTFFHSQKQKELLMKAKLMMYLNQYILQVHRTYKNF